MTIHLEQQRYSAVNGSEGQIFLRGVLDESSEFRQTIELIKERHRQSPETPIHLDFTHLKSGSWNGFLTLERILTELKYDYYLSHVSVDLFRYVALLPTLRKSKLGEVEVLVVSNSQESHERLQIRGYEVKGSLQANGNQNISLSKSGRFVCIGSQQIVGKYNFMFGDKAASPNGSLALPVSQKSEFDSWYDYVSFAAMTLALSEDLAKSIAISIIRLARELAAEYHALATGLEVAKNIDKSVWAREAETEANILADQAQQTESIYGQIILALKKNVYFAENIQKQLHVVEGDLREPIIEAIKSFRDIRVKLLEIVQLIENGGTETFSLLISIPGKTLFDDAFEQATEPSPEGLEVIREAFSIMDPLTEGDWQETKQAIFERTEDVEQLVSNLIVHTQGFDLLRQIVEHRISEIEEIEDYLNRGAPAEDFDSFRIKLYDCIKRKMVTDQEKLLVNAFVPDVLEHLDEAHRPGEVMLFK
jgi:hypothetical protein